MIKCWSQHLPKDEGGLGLDQVPQDRHGSDFFLLGVATVAVRLGVLPGFGGYFGRKMAVFGPKLRRFGRAPPNLAPKPRAATVEFLTQNLDLARPPPRLQDG